MNAPPHIIRLRGPWRWRAWAAAAGSSDSATSGGGELIGEMPFDWGTAWGQEFRGTIACRRRFGKPTGIGAADQVELVVGCGGIPGRVTLNGQLLGEIPARGGPRRFAVRDALEPRNELAVEIRLAAEDTPPPPKLDFEVRLEISVGGG